jgi:GMP synthase (glutamine-hydrolysing)
MNRIKPFLILQLRPEDAAADNEFEAFLKFGGLTLPEVRRVRMERERIPDLNVDDYSGIIVGGGPSNVSDPDEKKTEQQQRFEAELQRLLDRITESDFPYLGMCYGLGILARHLRGSVSKERYGEPVGAVTVNLTPAAHEDSLTKALPDSFRAFVGHKESCQEVPPGAVLLASSSTCPVQMIRYKRNVYATQFHTELDAEGLLLRIRVYKHAGYFPPEDADKLIAQVRTEHVTEPEKILRAFVRRYRRPA